MCCKWQSSMKFLASVFGVSLFLLLPLTAFPQERAASDLTFDELITRIEKLASSGAWRSKEWDGAEIQSWVEKRLARLADATNRKEIAAMSVSQALRHKSEAGRRGGGHIEVGRDVKIPHANHAVVLASGNVTIGHANDCLVIAGGAVEIAHGRNNVVFGGHYIHVSHDGRGRPGSSAQGSVLVSSGMIDVSHATMTICSAPKLVQISHATAVEFVDSPNRSISHDAASRVHTLDQPIVAARKDHALKSKLSLSWFVEDSGVVFRLSGKRYVAELGATIKDESGKPVGELKGWKLTYVSDHFALFKKGRDYMGFQKK